MLTLHHTKVIRQDGGWVAVAVLEGGGVSTPMSAPVRQSYSEAQTDRGCIYMTTTGPIYRKQPS